jgi:hypothetical protein
MIILLSGITFLRLPIHRTAADNTLLYFLNKTKEIKAAYSNFALPDFCRKLHFWRLKGVSIYKKERTISNAGQYMSLYPLTLQPSQTAIASSNNTTQRTHRHWKFNR